MKNISKCSINLSLQDWRLKLIESLKTNHDFPGLKRFWRTQLKIFGHVPHFVKKNNLFDVSMVPIQTLPQKVNTS
jgi:hypothetical protein